MQARQGRRLPASELEEGLTLFSKLRQEAESFPLNLGTRGPYRLDAGLALAHAEGTAHISCHFIPDVCWIWHALRPVIEGWLLNSLFLKQYLENTNRTSQVLLKGRLPSAASLTWERHSHWPLYRQQWLIIPSASQRTL